MVHPRMRGEHVALHYVPAAGYGSSPHARGTRFAGIFVARGNAVHPRMRGEHGSCRGPRISRVRFIPACAGNTILGTGSTPTGMVHPRMRGEHLQRACGWHGFLGSSPHARGTRIRGQFVDVPGRFIPACAGNTPTTVMPASRRAVHPRMRGEHIASCAVAAHFVGSSPHARGTLYHDNSKTIIERFIPACAGNTCFATPSMAVSMVHPRMRGEHARWAGADVRAVGSSPHARGTPGGNWHFRGAHRFIPACAGNTPATLGG